jgi:hypothetical protein
MPELNNRPVTDQEARLPAGLKGKGFSPHLESFGSVDTLRIYNEFVIPSEHREPRDLHFAGVTAKFRFNGHFAIRKTKDVNRAKSSEIKWALAPEG